MSRALRFSMAALVLGLVAVAAGAQDKGEGKKSAVPQTAEWKKLTSLVGQWEGFAETGGTKMPATVEARMTGDGSAIME
jgi:hypothetical protein